MTLKYFAVAYDSFKIPEVKPIRMLALSNARSINTSPQSARRRGKLRNRSHNLTHNVFPCARLCRDEAVRSSIARTLWDTAVFETLVCWHCWLSTTLRSRWVYIELNIFKNSFRCALFFHIYLAIFLPLLPVILYSKRFCLYLSSGDQALELGSRT
jgi:hypothetical protein